jgi:hypothetical protein
VRSGAGALGSVVGRLSAGGIVLGRRCCRGDGDGGFGVGFLDGYGVWEWVKVMREDGVVVVGG